MSPPFAFRMETYFFSLYISLFKKVYKINLSQFFYILWSLVIINFINIQSNNTVNCSAIKMLIKKTRAEIEGENVIEVLKINRFKKKI